MRCEREREELLRPTPSRAWPATTTAVETASDVKRVREQHPPCGPRRERESAETRAGSPDLSENRRTRDREAISMGARGRTERNGSQGQRRAAVLAQRRRERQVGLASDDAAAVWLRQVGAG